ncbi:unnamed protein product, partial [Phaeothamnion confervicola]
MGKVKRSNEKAGRPVPKSAEIPSSATEKRSGAPTGTRTNVKPLPFAGSSAQEPRDAFVVPGDKAFAQLLSTSYSGFVVDGPEELKPKVHEETRHAFAAMEAAGIFQTDVTQPFGLGTKCAKTFVTRTLVGEPGATYKYLGLRMFALPWSATEASGLAADALISIGRLNDRLRRRAAAHLEALAASRAAAGGDFRTGSCDFTLTLINRMEPSGERPDLKLEPLFKKDKASVSWHADSCLEHYSTIAVYHVTDAPVGAEPDWRIALRVEHDVEGPISKNIKVPGAAAGGKATPPVAVPLPSGAGYFLLDDFNHHHQHAVLSGESNRFASTHRVAKQEGHTFAYLSQRFAAVLGTAHRRSLKQWRAEQAVLTEIETEWLRQFYVQGSRHRDAHSWWHGPMEKCLTAWTQLERQTCSHLAALHGAAEAAAARRDGSGGGGGEGSKGTSLGKAERKALQRRRKHAEAVSALGEQAYTAVAEALEDRAAKRRGWNQREVDPVFKTMPRDCRPLPLPLFTAVAPSPLPRLLDPVAADVRAWQRVFLGEWSVALPPLPAYLVAAAADMVMDAAIPPSAKDETAASNPTELAPNEADEAKAGEEEGTEEKGTAAEADSAVPATVCSASSSVPALDWSASSVMVGLEMQQPWAQRLLAGEKTVETRAYPLPPGLVGRRIMIIQSDAGRDGVSALGNNVAAGAPGLTLVGSVV